MLRLIAIALLGITLSPNAEAADEKLSRLQGTVRLTRSKNVVGAAVVVRRESDAGKIYLTSSGDGGNFFVDGLADGDYRVHVFFTADNSAFFQCGQGRVCLNTLKDGHSDTGCFN